MKKLFTFLIAAMMAAGAWGQTMTLTLDPYPWNNSDPEKTLTVTMDLEEGESNYWTITQTLENTTNSDVAWRYWAVYTDSESNETSNQGNGTVIIPKKSSVDHTFHATINGGKVLTSHDGFSLGIADANTRLLVQIPAASGNETVTTYLNIRGSINLKSYTDAIKSSSNTAIGMNTGVNNTLMVYGDKSGYGEFKNTGFTAGVYQVAYNCRTCTATFTKANSYVLTVGDALAATLVLPQEATIPTGVRAYTLKYVGEELVATRVNGTLPENTPVLINTDKAGSFTFTLSGDAEYSFTENPENATAQNYINDVTSDDFVLRGAMQPHDLAQNEAYVLQNNASGLGFYKVTSKYYRIQPFRAYLTLPAAAPARLSIVYDDSETTGIETVKATKTGDGAVYSLSGQRVGSDYKGVVIKNGRKIIQK